MCHLLSGKIVANKVLMLVLSRMSNPQRDSQPKKMMSCLGSITNSTNSKDLFQYDVLDKSERIYVTFRIT